VNAAGAPITAGPRATSTNPRHAVTLSMIRAPEPLATTT
jgi:hypothetical protein